MPGVCDNTQKKQLPDVSFSVLPEQEVSVHLTGPLVFSNGCVAVLANASGWRRAALTVPQRLGGVRPVHRDCDAVIGGHPFALGGEMYAPERPRASVATLPNRPHPRNHIFQSRVDLSCLWFCPCTSLARRQISKW